MFVNLVTPDMVSMLASSRDDTNAIDRKRCQTNRTNGPAIDMTPDNSTLDGPSIVVYVRLGHGEW